MPSQQLGILCSWNMAASLALLTIKSISTCKFQAKGQTCSTCSIQLVFLLTGGSVSSTTQEKDTIPLRSSSKGLMWKSMTHKSEAYLSINEDCVVFYCWTQPKVPRPRILPKIPSCCGKCPTVFVAHVLTCSFLIRVFLAAHTIEVFSIPLTRGYGNTALVVSIWIGTDPFPLSSHISQASFFSSTKLSFANFFPSLNFLQPKSIISASLSFTPRPPPTLCHDPHRLYLESTWLIPLLLSSTVTVNCGAIWQDPSFPFLVPHPLNKTIPVIAATLSFKNHKSDQALPPLKTC